MSAYMVKDITINKVVSWLKDLPNIRIQGYICRYLKKMGYDMLNELDVIQLAHDMFELNIKAIEQRYGKGEAEKFRPLNFKYRFESYQTIIQTLKALKCWLYQCSEGDVPETKLYKTMEQIWFFGCQCVVTDSKEYDLADWG